MRNLHAPTVIEQVIAAAGLDEIEGGRAIIEQGWPQLQTELLRLGVDAETARTRQRSLAEAAVDFDNFPHLAQFHTAVDDVLVSTLPPELLRWAERVVSAPEPEVFDVLRTLLVERAAYDNNPIRRATWRVLLFESIRMNLVIIYRRSPVLAEVGLDTEDLSNLAENKMNQWLSIEPAIPEDVRPFNVILAAAVEGLERHADETRRLWLTLSNEYREEIARRARLEACLAELDARDALLIRNAFAEKLDERPLTVDVLQKRHPVAFDGVSRNALDQRFTRIHRRLNAGDGMTALQRRRGKSLLDIVNGASTQHTADAEKD